VYIGSYDSYLYAINILDGSIKWRFRTGGLIQSTVLAANGALYLGSFDKMIYKVDTSGTLKWKYNVSGVIETSPILYDMTKTYYPSITGLGQY
jgi:outer membrane protein assembly factor BamB